MIYLTLFLSFFRIGIFSFGGGLAMLPLIFQTVAQFGYMSQEEFTNLVALSQVTPGPVAVNAATYIGFDFAGLPGAVCATFGVALPSFLLIITAMKFLDKFNENKGIEAAFTGIRPATVGLIAAAAVFVGQSALLDDTVKLLEGIQLIPCLVFLATVILAAKFKMSPVKIIIIMAAVGVIFCS
ncbi:chromate transporter [Aminipila sp.]|uniref:chromate transporter n=1 Tax=Aminipila sp. TaxID=2060095 RepID=UPI001D38A457|nr:chromate transporter [Aminipila sp.]MBE6034927.1 chromate transporter [Clostridiales bacterium]